MSNRWMTGVLTVAAVALGAHVCGAAPAAAPELKTDSQKMSYSLGIEIVKSFGPNKGDVDIRALVRGLEDAYEGRKSLVSQEEQMRVKRAYAKKYREAEMERRKTAAAANVKKEEDFLAANGKKEGVVTTKSGLQYKVVREGKGAKPTAQDTVRVHYRGTLIDGTEFDSSHKRGQPAEFPANRVIAGWTEALQLMKVGSLYKLFLPARLAYGARGAPPRIGPNATLVFEVELLGIVK